MTSEELPTTTERTTTPTQNAFRRGPPTKSKDTGFLTGPTKSKNTKVVTFDGNKTLRVSLFN